MKLRKTQERILEYSGGKMAVSAVPGSGKTFILTMLVAKLLSEGALDPQDGQQVLIVTYMNSSVETFRARIRKRLADLGLEPIGFEVRTLHSLALDIVRTSAGSSINQSEGLLICDEAEKDNLIALAVTQWIDTNYHLWESLLRDSSPQERVRWQGIVERITRVFIRDAKNHRYSSDDILLKLSQSQSEAAQPISALSQIAEEQELYQIYEIPLLGMLAEIYAIYQLSLSRQALRDFDDLIWEACDILGSNDQSAEALRERWPYILEDEAQDSVPLQEQLLKLMTGADGNWVRVGDPNQAITSSFTSAHPRQFNAFLDRADVVSLPLPHSGRNAPFIFGAANSMVKWVVEKHPVPEVRKNAFRPLDILPAPDGDEQPNPPNNEAAIQIQVFRNRELEELPDVVKLAAGYAAEKVEHTLAILVPTHNVGYQVVRHLDAGGIDYDNQLRNTSEIKEVAASLTALLALLSSPLNTKAIAAVFSTLYEIEHMTVVSETIQPERIHTLLLSIHKPESFLFALGEREFISSLPMNVADVEEVRYLRSFAKYLRSLFSYRSLAFDDMILALADELYLRSTSTEASRRITDLAIAYQLAGATRSWLDIHPEWRLPEITSQLSSVARGKHSLPISIGESLGFKPRPGRITLATQHGAKGMEWDAVFLVGIDGQWIPSDLDSSFYGVRMPSGGDPVAEASAKLHQLMDGSPGIFPGRSATEAAHIELICERLRLLYVGITRARRYLHISRSLQYRTYDKDIDTKPAAVVGMLYRYVRANQQI